MSIYCFIILLYICISNQKILKNGIYTLIVDKLYLYNYKGNITVSNNFKHPNTFFRIKIISKTLNDIFYNIEHLNTKIELSYSSNKELRYNKENNCSDLWKFVEINDNNYIIENQDGCFVKVKKLNVYCYNIPISQATQFKIIKIFTEVKQKTIYHYNELLNREPIDVLIKYIDVRDPNLKRDGIFQMEKDYDNEELRYSIRSILNNIPWVRKIFILMPNEKVRYFKDYKLIKDKIIYVKDKDLLGYDSSNCNAFLFRYWKMKKFGISDNIIIMDDDYFIGNKLKKSDFFYVKNGEVLPIIITSNFVKIDKKTVKKNLDFYEKKAKINEKDQNNDVFLYSKYLTYEFILNYFNISFNESIYIPDFTHTAIPVNLKDAKEIFQLANKSKYKYNTLDCPYRIYGYLLYQLFVLAYTFMKYDRRVKNIPNKFIQLNDSISANYKFSLFCINKGAGNYSFINFYKAKIAMEYLFPNPSPYEIVDYSLLKLSFNLTYSLDKIITINEKKISNMITREDFFYSEVNLILFFLLIILKINYKYYFYNYSNITNNIYDLFFE